MEEVDVGIEIPKIGPSIWDRFWQSVAITPKIIGFSTEEASDPDAAWGSRVEEAYEQSDPVIDRFAIDEIYLDLPFQFLAIGDKEREREAKADT